MWGLHGKKERDLCILLTTINTQAEPEPAQLCSKREAPVMFLRKIGSSLA
jgi:hypothetical protein